MPAKVDSKITERLTKLKANHEAWGAPRLTQELEGMYGAKAPSRQWVSLWLRDTWGPMSEAKKHLYRYVYWPESFGPKQLSWDAAPAILELLANLHSKGLGRPTLEVARDFWNVTRSIPDAPFDVRLMVTGRITVGKKLDKGGDSLDRTTEWYAAYGSWRSEGDRHAYEAAMKDEHKETPRSQAHTKEEDKLWQRSSYKLKRRYTHGPEDRIGNARNSAF